MSPSKKIDLRDFAAIVYLSEAQNVISPPSPLTHCIRVYSILFLRRREGGGGGSPREKVRGATVHKAGSKIQT
jgi:hypothetical protein